MGWFDGDSPWLRFVFKFLGCPLVICGGGVLITGKGVVGLLFVWCLCDGIF